MFTAFGSLYEIDEVPVDNKHLRQIGTIRSPLSQDTRQMYQTTERAAGGKQAFQ